MQFVCVCGRAREKCVWVWTPTHLYFGLFSWQILQDQPFSALKDIFCKSIPLLICTCTRLGADFTQFAPQVTPGTKILQIPVGSEIIGIPRERKGERGLVQCSTWGLCLVKGRQELTGQHCEAGFAGLLFSCERHAEAGLIQLLGRPCTFHHISFYRC